MRASVVRLFVSAVLCSFFGSPALAQTPPVPATDITLRSIKAVGYQVGGGDTTVDLKATILAGSASGEAKVEAKPAVTMVEVKVKGLKPPMQIGTEFMAYVIWAVSPEGRTVNLGEIRPDGDGEMVIKATTQFQSFALLVTAEPYPSVRQPSEMVVLENDVRKNTKGRLFIVSDYQLMKRSQYLKMANPLALSLDLKQAPIEMYQARNAVEIAKMRGAAQYAPAVLSRAQGALDLAENGLARKADKKEVLSFAKQAMQASEDARALTAEKREEERVANERAAAAAQAKAEAEVKAAAEAAVARQRAEDEARRQAELTAAREAQLKAEAALQQAQAARQQAVLRSEAVAREAQLKIDAAAREAQLKAEAAAREAADRDARVNAEAASAARDAAARAEIERARMTAEVLRAQLLDQFNRILETRDTPRGLVITMADVLFDTGSYELKPATREALARLSGVVLAHQGLKLEVEGHTDSTGSDELNQRLSEQRAGTVRGYLVQQGLSASSISSTGLGKSAPVADNTTATGRQKNRRVELVVSGEVIGVRIGG